jgi:hypothetical protein
MVKQWYVQYQCATCKTMSNISEITKKLKEQGTNSRKVGEQKTLAGLTWVYRWGWSYPLLVDKIASPGRRGLAKKLVDQNLLAAWPTESAGGVKGVPQTVLCLTKDGQAIVEGEISRDQLLNQNLKDDIPRHQLRHDALVQRATAMNNGLRGFQTPKEIASKSIAGVKQPDAIWVLENGQRLGLELEMTNKKSGREINQTVLALLKAVQKNNHHNLNSICILSNSRAILEEYKDRLTPGAKVSAWSKDNSGRWFEMPEKQFVVPEWAIDKFILQKIEI